MTTIHYIASGLLATSSGAALALDGVWRLTAFLCVGTSMGILWCCLSKKGSEERRMTNARIIAGIIGGVIVPRIVESAVRFFSGRELGLEAADPLIVMGTGVFFSIFGFFIMHTALRKAETREDAVGAALAKTVEKKIAKSLGTEIEPEKKGE